MLLQYTYLIRDEGNERAATSLLNARHREGRAGGGRSGTTRARGVTCPLACAERSVGRRRRLAPTTELQGGDFCVYSDASHIPAVQRCWRFRRYCGL